MWTDPDGRTVTIERPDGAHDRHRNSLGSWRIERGAGELARPITLAANVASPTKKKQATIPDPPSALGELREGEPLIFDLGRAAYRRSEETWEEAGRPTARVGLMRMPNHIVLDLIVRKSGGLTFVPAGAVNPYDNESPDINGDSLQLYLADVSGASGWVLVPEFDATKAGKVRARVIDGWLAPRAVRASWRRLEDGYSLRARVRYTPLPAMESEIAIGVVVNEKPTGRERRRGQLVLGGAPGEFVYLRGDREDRDRLPRFRLTD